MLWLQIWQRIQGKFLAPKHGVNPGKQKVMILLTPVLLVVFIVVLTQVLKKTPVAPPKPTRAFAQSGATAASAGKINWQIPSPYPANLRDPMQLGSVKTEQKDGASELVVKGIVYSDDKPAAVIGNDIVFEGDTVGGAKVLKINEDSVEFQKNDKKWIQKLSVKRE
jgi:hypothetical protein